MELTNSPALKWPFLKAKFRVVMIPNAQSQKKIHRVIEDGLSREQSLNVIQSLHEYESGRMFCTVNEIMDDTTFGVIMPDGEVRVFTVQGYIPTLPVYRN